MGNSASSAKELQVSERAFIRSLGDRYPLGDTELRKWCWVHGRLSSSAKSPVGPDYPEEPLSSISLLAVWSAVYGDYDPYNHQLSQSRPPLQNKNPMNSRLNAASKVKEAIANVEQHILPAGLCSRIVQLALGLSKSIPHSQQQSTSHGPIQSAAALESTEEISTFENSFYSIASTSSQLTSSNQSSSLCDNASKSQGLEDFLEGMSTSCGRRGSRKALTKFFRIMCSNKNRDTAEASAIIEAAYCLTLAASYLRKVAANMSDPQKGEQVEWKDFVPQNKCNEMQSMAESLLNSASKQRQGGGGRGGNYSFDYSSPVATNTTTSTSNNNKEVSLDEFSEWAETATPMMAALPTFLITLLHYFTPSASCDDKEPQFPPGVTPLWIPSLTIDDEPSHKKYSSPISSFFHAPESSSFDLFALSCTSVPLASGRWHRLFSSEVNGLSCNRLMHSILGYGGPTLILIRNKDTSGTRSGVFGVYTFTPWSQESANFYGNSDCFLFRLAPDPMAVYRPKSVGDMGGMEAFGTNKTTTHQESETSNYMYFNPEARSKGYDGLAHGIGFGGTPHSPRLFIDEVLDKCQAAPEDLTYENGPLLSGCNNSSSKATSHYEVEAMEAWGVGTSNAVEEALMARGEQRKDAAEIIRKAMKGAKGAFLDDMQSGLMGNKNFQHREQMRGRDGCCELDNVEEK